MIVPPASLVAPGRKGRAVGGVRNAVAIVGGALVLLGRIEVADLRNGSVDVVIGESTLLLVGWLALAIVGIVVQWFTRPEAVAPASPPP